MSVWTPKPRPLSKAQRREEALREHEQLEIAMDDSHKPWHALPVDVHTQARRPDWVAPADWERAKAQLQEILLRDPSHYADLK